MSATPQRVTGWKISVTMADGKVFDLTGHVYGYVDQAEMMQIVDALTDGLRRAGYEPEVTITRTTEEAR